MIALERITPSRAAVLAAYPELAAKTEALQGDDDLAASRSDAAYHANESAKSEYRDLIHGERAAEAEASRANRRRDPTEVAAAKASIERARRLVERTSAEAKATTRRNNDGRRLLNNCIRYLDQVGSDPTPVVVKMPKGKLLDTIEEKMTERASKKKERSRKRQARRLPEELEADLRQELASIAERPIFHITEGDRLSWARQAVDAAPDDLRPGILPTAIDPTPLLARVHRAELEAEIHRLVEARYATNSGLVMSLPEKLSELMRLDSEILAIERIIAAAIWEARAEGADVPFPVLDPRAVFGIAGKPLRTSRAEEEAEDDEFVLNGAA